MPAGRAMQTVDEIVVSAPVSVIFPLAADVEAWPMVLRHYRHVCVTERSDGDSCVVEMSANRPFGFLPEFCRVTLNWPTWWLSLMQVDRAAPAIRFRHVGGITRGMDVEWSFTPENGGTRVRILHVWDGPRFPLFRAALAKYLIGPVFIHGIASRTLAGLGAAAEAEVGATGRGGL